MSKEGGSSWAADSAAEGASTNSALPSGPGSFLPSGPGSSSFSRDRPMSAQEPIDLSKIPHHGPFNAFIGNLPFDTDEEQMKSYLCEQNGKLDVKSVRLAKNRDDGRHRGFGYVEFEDRESLMWLLESQGKLDYQGRILRIDLSESRDKTAWKGEPKGMVTIERSKDTSMVVGDSDAAPRRDDREPWRREVSRQDTAEPKELGDKWRREEPLRKPRPEVDWSNVRQPRAVEETPEEPRKFKDAEWAGPKKKAPAALTSDNWRK